MFVKFTNTNLRTRSAMLLFYEYHDNLSVVQISRFDLLNNGFTDIRKSEASRNGQSRSEVRFHDRL